MTPLRSPGAHSGLTFPLRTRVLGRELPVPRVPVVWATPGPAAGARQSAAHSPLPGTAPLRGAPWGSCSGPRGRPRPGRRLARNGTLSLAIFLHRRLLLRVLGEFLTVFSRSRFQSAHRRFCRRVTTGPAISFSKSAAPALLARAGPSRRERGDCGDVFGVAAFGCDVDTCARVCMREHVHVCVHVHVCAHVCVHA